MNSNNKPPSSWTRRTVIGGMAAVAAMGVIGGSLIGSPPAGLTHGKSRARAVNSSGKLPAKVDVVVVGAGNIGACTALELVERGLRVCLCEKGVVAGEASGRSLGYIDSLFSDPIKFEIIERSKTLWKRMNERVQADTGFRLAGIGALFESSEALGAAEEWLKIANQHSPNDAKILSSSEAAKLANNEWPNLVGSLYSPTDALAEPQLFASAVVDKIIKQGGSVLQNCAVRGIERSVGKVSAVVTEHGRVECSAVVVAGGAWSPIFAKSLDIDLPQFMAFASSARVPRTSVQANAIVGAEANVVIRPNLSGGYDFGRPIAVAPVTPSVLKNLPRLWPAYQNLGSQLQPAFDFGTFFRELRIPNKWALDQKSPFESNRILEPQVNNRLLTDTFSTIAERFPSLAKAQVSERWAGVLTSTLDNMPFISAVEQIPGLFIGSGFYFGMTMAPAAGEALADLVTGHKPKIDLNPYRLSRFSDDSELIFRA